MADEMISCEITGLESFDAQLSRLEQSLRREIMQDALTQAGVVLAQAQVAHAPEKTDDIPGGNSLPKGALKSDIVVEVDLEDGPNIQAAKVGPTPDTAYVGRFLEFGHAQLAHGDNYEYEIPGANGRTRRKHRKHGKVLGFVEPHRWMQPAFDESANAALQKFQDVIVQGIEAASAGDGENQ
jgi:hypothetical protein